MVPLFFILNGAVLALMAIFLTSSIIFSTADALTRQRPKRRYPPGFLTMIGIIAALYILIHLYVLSGAL